MDQIVPSKSHRDPWNKGKLVGQKAPLKLKDIWAIRVRLQISDRKSLYSVDDSTADSIRDHRITRSARSTIDSGMVMPSALAVLRLTTSSKRML